MSTERVQLGVRLPPDGIILLQDLVDDLPARLGVTSLTQADVVYAGLKALRRQYPVKKNRKEKAEHP